MAIFLCFFVSLLFLMKIQSITYLSLGTNQGNKIENLQNAINLIDEKIGEILKISSVYATPAWGFKGDDFYNICVKVLSYLQPEALIDSLLAIENDLGRERSSEEGYQNRRIDIDILLYDDEIIFSKELTIPHPKMLERKFVMVPLNEIAPTFVHPLNKQEISICLLNCDDSSKITIVNKKLKIPISITEKYNYIAIEGNIGAGKTTLAKMLSDDFNAKKVLERFADNPFLPKFYKDQERFAFPLEMSFLADRYQQLTDDLAQFDLFKNFIVSDYYIFKSLIFAQVTLQKEEYFLYRKIFDIMYKEITKPDLYVYLYQNTERLLENIKKRGRDYEQSITSSYLKNIQDGYKNFINTEKNLKILLIDVSKIDFVNKRTDYSYIVNKIKNF